MSGNSRLNLSESSARDDLEHEQEISHQSCIQNATAHEPEPTQPAPLENLNALIESAANRERLKLLRQSKTKFKKLQQKVAQTLEWQDTALAAIDAKAERLSVSLQVVNDSSVLQQCFEQLRNPRLSIDSVHSFLAKETTPVGLSVCLNEGSLDVLLENLEQYQIDAPLATPYSRCMLFGSDTLIVTGGLFETVAESRTAWLVNVKTRAVQSLPPLMLGRSFHAMTLLQGKPAVLGGFAQVSLSSVEVFDGNRWVGGPFLGVPRHAHAACSIEGQTFVVGGRQTQSGGDSHVRHLLCHSVERFQGHYWERIDLRLPFESLDFLDEPGVIPLSAQELLVLGGWTDKVEVIKYSLATHAMTLVTRLETPSKFPANCWLMKGREIVGLSDDGALLSFSF